MDSTAYQALGQSDDPNNRQQYQQHGAPPPTPYGQNHPPQPGYGPPPTYQQAQQYDSQFGSQPQGPYAPPMGASAYGGQQAYQPGGPPPPPPGGVADVTAQLGGMGITDGAIPGTISKASKKKQRHAFHEIDQAPAAAPTTPFAPSGGQPQFGGQFAAQAAAPQQFTPAFQGGVQASSQFPVPANPQFTPANPPTSAAQYNASVSGRPGSSSNSVDPNSIPSIPTSRNQAQALYNTNAYPTLAQHPPPPTTTDFAVIDQGNASPKFARLTMYTVPSTAEVLASTSLPLAWVLQPLAKQRLDEPPIPVLDFGEAGPPRCRRCRTYINPFMTFTQGGGKFVCNMCAFPNDVAQEYFSPVDMHGRRVDREQRPELTRGVVEYVVPKEYWARPLAKGEVVEDRALRWLFLIDVSMEAHNRGGLSAVVAGIRQALYGESLSDDEEFQRLPKGTKVGIMTYDKEIQYYNLNPSLDQAQMLVMPDLEDPFVPLSTGFFVDPYESRNIIEQLLQSLPNLFTQIRTPEPALLPTLFAALDSLEKTGGKIICSLSALPTFGPGRLHLREDTKLFGTDKELTLFQAEHQSWRKVATKMVDAGIGIDFFLTPHTYIDNATIGHVASTTGGEVFFYPNFVEPRDSGKLIADIAHTVRRETGYQALMKVRCSNGLQVSNYAGNFYQRTSGGDLEFGVIDEDKSMSVGFSYDGKLDPKVDAHFQAALLYTTRGGERRVRCINVVAAVTGDGKDALKFVDQDAVIAVMAKEAATRMIERPLKEIRGSIVNKCVEILAAYRKNFSGPSPPGQLILPEALKEFALFILCLLKCRALRGGSVSSDMRTNSMRLLKSMPLSDLSTYLYPFIIPLHNLLPHHGFPLEDTPSVLSVPPSMRASFSRIDEGGVYLIDNSQTCILWIHAHVSPNLLADLFGEQAAEGGLAGLDPYMERLPVVDTLLNSQVRNLIRWVGERRGAKRMPGGGGADGVVGGVQLARQGLDGAEYEFAGMLVEDRNSEEKSYVDWLVHVHRFVQLEISGQRRADDAYSSTSSSSYGSPADAAAAVQAASFAGLRPPYW